MPRQFVLLRFSSTEAASRDPEDARPQFLKRSLHLADTQAPSNCFLRWPLVRSAGQNTTGPPSRVRVLVLWD